MVSTSLKLVRSKFILGPQIKEIRNVQIGVSTVAPLWATLSIMSGYEWRPKIETAQFEPYQTLNPNANAHIHDVKSRLFRLPTYPFLKGSD